MTYTKAHPPLPETSEQLRARIPGWGADLDPAVRPSVPREQFQDTGAHWDFPDAMATDPRRERSIEHAHLTPVYGTVQPLKGLSGAVRRFAYDRFSEGRAAHWLLLMAGDRLDVAESRVQALVSGRPDNPLTETGVLAEVRGSGVRSRAGRVDVRHQVLDPFVALGPTIAAAAVAVAGVRALRRRLRG